MEVDGRETGIENERDNARQLRLNACTVSNFRNQTDQLSVSIEGDRFICELESSALTVSIDGATGPYTYEWKVNGTGMNWDNTSVFDTDPYTIVSAFPDYVLGDVIYIRLEVTAGNGDLAIAYHDIEIVDGGYNGLLCLRSPNTNSNESYEDAISVYPNPSYSFSTTVSYSISKTSSPVLRLYNVNGILLKSIKKGELKAGSYTEQIDFEEHTSAFFFIELDLGYSIKRIPLVLIK